MDVDKYILDIKNKLKIKGYVGKKITYSEFKELYKEYGAKMLEKEFADTIATEQICIPNAGHINSESGYDTFEEIENYL